MENAKADPEPLPAPARFTCPPTMPRLLRPVRPRPSQLSFSSLLSSSIMREDSSGGPPPPAFPLFVPLPAVAAAMVVAESRGVGMPPVGVLGTLLSLRRPKLDKLALRLDIDGRGGSGPGLVAVGVAGDEGEEN